LSFSGRGGRVKSLRNPEYLESMKQNLLSGEWFLLFGDNSCVLPLVERLETVTHVLAIGVSKIVVLVKKSDELRELLGISKEVTKQIVAMAVNEAGELCVVAMFFSDNEDTRRRVVDEVVEHLRKLSEDEDEEDEKPSTTTI
jgi:hypothetical protein